MEFRELQNIREKDASWVDHHPQEVFNAYVEQMAFATGQSIQHTLSLAVVREKSKLMGVSYTGDGYISEEED